MKNLFQRFRRKRPASPDETDLVSLPALAHLVSPADPDPQLFVDIEAIIDQEEAVQRRSTDRRTFGPRALVLALFAGCLIGGSTITSMQSHQQVVVQPHKSSPWIPLGSVTLKGAALRSFVRAKCDGRSHFLITMHRLQDHNSIESSNMNPTLIPEGEKIRIECIF